MNDAELIKELGGPAKAAKLFEVTPQAVSQWAEKGIPRARMMYLKVVRPDLFKQAEQPDQQPSRAAA